MMVRTDSEFRLGVEAMTEKGPPLAAQAVEIYIARHPQHHIVFYGDASARHELLRRDLVPPNSNGDHPDARVLFKLCPDVIPMKARPQSGERRRDSSIAQLARDLKSGEVDMGVSAGNTAFLVRLASIYMKLLPEVRVPALAARVPREMHQGRAHLYLVDAGANPDPSAHDLLIYACLGLAHCQIVEKMSTTPRLGLQNNGEEEWKGSVLLAQTHANLKHLPCFDGNIEHPFQSKVDVLLSNCGNLTLKTAESMAALLPPALKRAAEHNLQTKIGLGLAKTALKAELAGMKQDAYGGAPILGTDAEGSLIKLHGAATVDAILEGMEGAYLLHKLGHAKKMTSLFKSNWIHLQEMLRKETVLSQNP